MYFVSPRRLLIVLAFATGLLFLLSVPYFLPAQSVTILPTQSVLPTDAPLIASSDTIALDNPAEIAASVEPVRVPADNRPVPNRVILQFAPNATQAERAAYMAQVGLTPVTEIASLNSVVVQLQPGITLEESPLVSTQPDYYVQAQEAPTRNDPLYAQQWGLTAVGIPALWGTLPANTPSVTVAVIDSGICANHPDLAGHVGAGWNFVNDNALVEDLFGHGCAVSGIIAAQMDNALGIAGIVPNIQIMPLRVLDANGVGRYSDVAAAIVYAVDHNAQFINVSLGGTQPSALLESAVTYAESHQVKIIAAAGNGSSTSLLYPAAYPAVIAVGAIDTTLQRSSFSNYGAGIDIQAPGRDILSTKSDGTYGRFSGTSFAAPFVTGALILAQSSGQTITLDGGVLHAGTSESPVINIPPVTSPSVTVDADVISALQQNGQAHVMIALALPPSAQSDDDTLAIAQAQNDVLAQLANTDFVLAQQFVHVPALAGTLTASALNVLQNNEAVARIYIDEPTEAASFRSVIAINGDDVQAGAVGGYHLTGAGVTVAVLDSGIDMTNPAVSDDVVKQKCFSSTSSCPGNLPVADVAPDSSLHGTNISAIITAPEGVAPDANIVAVRVLDDYGRGQSSDWVAALDWITSQVSNGTLDIDIINMSLGSTRLYKPAVGSSLASCNQVFPAEAIAIQNVLALGIPVFAATGNQGSSDSINSPACVSGVIGVGAIYDSSLGNEPDTGTYRDQLHGSWPGCSDANTQPGQITCFTNSNEWMDIVAPGAQIIIGGTGGSGTSQASPHAAGIAALMLQGRTLDPTPASASPANIEAILRSTGLLITDPRNGRVFRQLDALEALKQFINPTLFAGCTTVTGTSRTECDALVALYQSAGGTQWLPATGWLQNNAPCTWVGVTCTGNDVTGLNLYAMNVHGSIPPEIAGLQHLEILNLSSAEIQGGLANLGQLSALRELRLDGLRAPSTTLPSEFGQLTHLEILSVSYSNLVGTIPASYGNLTSLRELYLNSDYNLNGANRLTGALPAEFSQLTKLQILNLTYNNLSGMLPDLSTLTQLKTLNLSHNQLTGTLPANWPSSLVSFYINNNQFTGALPAFTHHPVLKDFDASYNQFTGTIPSFGTSPIDYLTLSYNTFTDVSPDIGNMPVLSGFYVDHNHLTSLPDTIGNLRTDVTIGLNVHNNWLTTLPDSIVNLTLYSPYVCYNRMNPATMNPAIVAFLDGAGCGQNIPWSAAQVIPPTNFTAAVESPNSIRLTWTPPALNLWKYEIFYAPVGGEFKFYGGLLYRNPGNYPLNSEFLVTGLQANTTYQFKIRSVIGEARDYVESEISTPITAAPTSGNTCASGNVQGIPAGECQALEALYNSADGANWNIPKPRWMHLDNPRLLVFGPNKPDAYLVDQATGGMVVRYSGHTSGINSAVFNTSGSELLTSSWDGTARVWNTVTGEELRSINVGSIVYRAIFNLAGNRILTLSGDNTVRLWNRATGAESWHISTYSPINWTYVGNIEFSPDGTRVVIADMYAGVKLVNVSDGSIIRAWQPTDLTIYDAIFSADGTTIVTASGNNSELGVGNIQFWNASTGALIKTIDTETVNDIAFSPDGTRILAFTTDFNFAHAEMYRVSDDTRLWRYEYPDGYQKQGVFASDGSQVVTVKKIENPSSLVYLDASSGSVALEFPARLISNVSEPVSISTVAYTPVPLAGLPVAYYPCTWAGVTCSSGHVTGLTLSSSGLAGTIPPQLGNLTFLKTLDLSFNELRGELPVALTTLAHLETLNLYAAHSTSDLNIGWTLPPEIGNLTSLKTLNLAVSSLQGELPTTLGNLVNLQTLDLSANENLTGNLPTTLGNLLHLQTLDLSRSDFTGSIPASFGNMAALKTLTLYDNFHMTGPLPATLGNLSHLESLTIFGTQISGSIPASFGNLTSLKTLSFTSVYGLSGPLPPELGNLSNLETLEIIGSGLTGSIPATLGNLSHLKKLNLSSDRLTGNIPSQLGQLHSLTSIDLSTNRLSGTIPTSLNITNLPNLNSMSLVGNQLQGEVPVELTGFTGSIAVSLWNNRLFTTRPAVKTWLDSTFLDWERSMTTAPLNVKLLETTSGTATLSWTPRCDDPLTPQDDCQLLNGYFEVFCSPTPGGPYTSVGRTPDTSVKQLKVTGLSAESTLYCVVRSSSRDNWDASMRWYSEDSNEVPVLTSAIFGVEVPVENIPSIFDVDVPEAENPEEFGDVCSEETGRAVSFRGSGRAVSFRGSGRAVSFRGSGDAQLVIASTEGSAFDTVLTVWRVPAAPEGQPPTPFTEANAQFMGCNDDSPFSGTEPGDPNGGVERPPDSPAYSSYLAVPFDRDFDFYFVVYAKHEEAGGLLFSVDGVGETITGLPAQQVAALSALYSSTGGAGWANHSGWFDTDNPCSWYGVTCSAGSITALNLANNHLVGTFPAALGDLTTLTSLQLQNNALRGTVPDTIAALTSITTLDTGYNGLSASGAALTYLNAKDADWSSTQTVPPTGITPGIISNDGATVTFTPIAYTAHGGFYEAGCGLSANGPYVVNNRTANKSATSLTLQNLLPGTPYFCTLRTFTPTHTGQSSEILSTASAEFTFTTSVPGWLVGANGSYTIAPTPPFPLIFSMNTSNLPSAYPGDLPVSVCGAQVGRAVSFRGSGGGLITVNSSGTDYPEAVSIWSVPTGQPAVNATQIDCADSRQDDHFAYANIPADHEFIVIVSGNFRTSGTLKLTMKNVGEPPVALNNSYNGVEDTALTVVAPGVLKNDVNLAGAALTLSVTTPPTHGTVTLAQNGGFVYTPSLNYNGADGFAYQISDSVFPASTATVSLTLSPVQDAPLPVNDSALIPQNTPTIVNVLTNDIEPDGEALTLTAITNGAHGTATNNGNGTLTFTPENGYIGSDTLTYRACDLHNACTGATVNLMIRPVTGAITSLTLPVTGSGDFMNEDGTRLEGERASLWLGNGSSTSYLGLRFTGVLIPPDTVISSAILQVYSPLTQTPPVSLLIAAEAVDDSAPFTLTTPPSRRPATSARTSAVITTPWSTGWQTVGDVTPLLNELVIRDGWQSGKDMSLLIRGTGVPRQRRLLATTGTIAPRLIVTFTYPDANLPPVAVEDTTRTNQNTAVIIPVLSNDTDPYEDVLHIGALQTPAHGSAVDSGSEIVTYTPTTGFIGTDSFTYQACDAGGLCTTGTVTVNVTPTPGVPTTLTFVINSDTDDVNQDRNGLSAGQSVLGLGQNNGSPLYAGLRFADVFIPPGSTITSARLEMYIPANQTGDIQLLIGAEASNDSPPFSLTSLPAQRRVTAPRSSTDFSAPWTGGTWQIISADLAAAVQSVTNRTGWRYRQHLTLILRGTGDTRRMVSGYESNPAFAPRLVVDFVPAAMASLSVEPEPDSPDDGELIDPIINTPTEIPVTPDIVVITPDATEEVIDTTPDATEAVIGITPEITATPTDTPTEIPAATEEVPATVENPPEAATEPAASATEEQSG